jgi:hypothetical protein
MQRSYKETPSRSFWRGFFIYYYSETSLIEGASNA